MFTMMFVVMIWLHPNLKHYVALEFFLFSSLMYILLR